MSDYGEKNENTPNFKPLTPKGKSTAVAVKDGGKDSAPLIKAAARGVLADKILEIARENDIKNPRRLGFSRPIGQARAGLPCPDRGADGDC